MSIIARVIDVEDSQEAVVSDGAEALLGMPTVTKRQRAEDLRVDCFKQARTAYYAEKRATESMDWKVSDLSAGVPLVSVPEFDLEPAYKVQSATLGAGPFRWSQFFDVFAHSRKQQLLVDHWHTQM